MPLRVWFNRARRRLAQALLHRMVFGERSQGRALPHTRIAPSTCIVHEDRLHLGDHVFIGPYCFIEASAGITIGEGVQITHHASIVSHSSHRSIRVLGRAYVEAGVEPPGYLRAPVHVGDYSFVGPHSLIEPGAHVGKGSIVCAYAQVRGRHPDFAVLAGQPARVVGDTRERDEALLAAHPELRAFYEAWAGPGGVP